MKTLIAALLLVGVATVLSNTVTAPQLPNLPIANFVSNLISKAIKSINEFQTMTAAQRFAHALANCPGVTAGMDNATISTNIETFTKEFVDTKEFLSGFTCMSIMAKSAFHSTLKAVPTPEAISRPPIQQRRKRQATTAPASVDWRTQGYVTPVKNQGQCGSCWTFSATGAMEGAVFKKTGKLPNFSEQNLVDCVTASSGCNGGWMTDAYTYVNKTQGINNQTTYPYIAKQNPTCKYTAATNAGKVSNYAYTNQDDEVDLKSKLATVGPMAVAIDATYIQNYVSGVYSCTNFTGVNHGVLAVGYGTDTTVTPNLDYYIIKNSWGTGWGESGYIRIVRNKGSSLGCGIPTYANYPIA